MPLSYVFCSSVLLSQSSSSNGASWTSPNSNSKTKPSHSTSESSNPSIPSLSSTPNTPLMPWLYFLIISASHTWSPYFSPPSLRPSPFHSHSTNSMTHLPPSLSLAPSSPATPSLLLHPFLLSSQASTLSVSKMTFTPTSGSVSSLQSLLMHSLAEDFGFVEKAVQIGKIYFGVGLVGVMADF